MKNVKKMIQAGLKKFTVITILGVFLMTSLIPVSAATKVSKRKCTEICSEDHTSQSIQSEAWMENK